MKKTRRSKPDSQSQIISFISVILGVIALVLTCVGVATPSWYVRYTLDSNYGVFYKSSSANFFYSCTYFIDGSFGRCVKRNDSSYAYPSFAQIAWTDGYSQRMQNAGALCIVGIIFLTVGTITTFVMTVIYLPLWINFLPPVVLFLACLFMVAGMAEGSNFFIYNGYSVILYQSGHVITIFALLTSALAAGRNHFARSTEAHINTVPQ
ncbi:hypothetical protein I4U23_019610 [Adineta vaga]|nr:hypothetical protein I4U23_019610 [Adineta vaga]